MQLSNNILHSTCFLHRQDYLPFASPVNREKALTAQTCAGLFWFLGGAVGILESVLFVSFLGHTFLGHILLFPAFGAFYPSLTLWHG